MAVLFSSIYTLCSGFPGPHVFGNSISIRIINIIIIIQISFLFTLQFLLNAKNLELTRMRTLHQFEKGVKAPQPT